MMGKSTNSVNKFNGLFIMPMGANYSNVSVSGNIMPTYWKGKSQGA